MIFQGKCSHFVQYNIHFIDSLMKIDQKIGFAAPNVKLTVGTLTRGIFSKYLMAKVFRLYRTKIQKSIKISASVLYFVFMWGLCLTQIRHFKMKGIRHCVQV